jgi:hypothetical protein
MTIDALIMLAVGIYVSAVGFGFVPAPGQSNPNAPAWARAAIKHFVWLGPLLVIIAIFLAVFG